MPDTMTIASTKNLPEGFTIERDTDGDYVLCVPEDVTVFSEPGEGLLLGRCTLEEAEADAAAYLAQTGYERDGTTRFVQLA